MKNKKLIIIDLTKSPAAKKTKQPSSPQFEIKSVFNKITNQIVLSSDSIDLTLQDQNLKLIQKTDKKKLSQDFNKRIKASILDHHRRLNSNQDYLNSNKGSSDEFKSSKSQEEISLNHSNVKSNPTSTKFNFLPSDVKLLNIYLFQPISRVLTTCSSIILPSQPIADLPLNQLEEYYSQDQWRIKREIISCPESSNRSVDCWISGQGWPAKSFIVCGWLVGIDRREKFISFYIDDGTAVLECQSPISQLNKVFDLSTENGFLTNINEKKEESMLLTETNQLFHENSIKMKKKSSLDSYRRLSPPPQKLKNSAEVKTNLKTQRNYQLKEENEITEETILKFTNLKIGITLKMIGQPKELFRNSKRVLDLEKVIIINENFHYDHDEEIHFRNQLIHLRNNVYNQNFRLSNVWPDALKLSNNQNDEINPKTNLNLNQKEKETKKLKLLPVSKLKPNQITFTNFLNYLILHIKNKYEDDSNFKVLNYFELKEKIINFENVKFFNEFYIDDIFNRPSPLNHDQRINHQDEKDVYELNQFIKMLIQIKNEQLQTELLNKSKSKSKNQSIFLTEEENFNKIKNLNRIKEIIIKKSIHSLIYQGIIIISPFNENGFTIPNYFSLSPKLVQIILLHFSHSNHPNQSTLDISSKKLFHTLTSDQLWKFVDFQLVESILSQIGFKRIHHDSWSISTSC